MNEIEKANETKVELDECRETNNSLYQVIHVHEILSDAKDKKIDDLNEMLRVGDTLRSNLNTIIDLREKQIKKQEVNIGWLKIGLKFFIATTLIGGTAYFVK